MRDVVTTFENVKVIICQVRETLNKVDEFEDHDVDKMTKFSLSVDSGACGNVIDPRELLGYLFIGIVDSRQGSIFFTASVDPIFHLGGKERQCLHQWGCVENSRNPVHHRVEAAAIREEDDGSRPFGRFLQPTRFSNGFRNWT